MAISFSLTRTRIRFCSVWAFRQTNGGNSSSCRVLGWNVPDLPTVPHERKTCVRLLPVFLFMNLNITFDTVRFDKCLVTPSSTCPAENSSSTTSSTFRFFCGTLALQYRHFFEPPCFVHSFSEGFHGSDCTCPNCKKRQARCQRRSNKGSMRKSSAFRASRAVSSNRGTTWRKHCNRTHTRDPSTSPSSTCRRGTCCAVVVAAAAGTFNLSLLFLCIWSAWWDVTLPVRFRVIGNIESPPSIRQLLVATPSVHLSQVMAKSEDDANYWERSSRQKRDPKADLAAHNKVIQYGFHTSLLQHVGVHSVQCPDGGVEADVEDEASAFLLKTTAKEDAYVFVVATFPGRDPRHAALRNARASQQSRGATGVRSSKST